MRRDGFTLIEVVAACALLTAALAMIWGTWLSAGETMDALSRKTAATEEASAALARIARELRQASVENVEGLPGAVLHYRVPTDLDGNGIPLDERGSPEWGPLRSMGCDLTDANSDGFTNTQLVVTCDGETTVWGNNLLPGDGPAGGLWFERQGDAIRVSLRTVMKTRRRGLALPMVLAQDVTPRNP